MLLVSIGLAVPQIKKRCRGPVVPGKNRVSHDPCVSHTSASYRTNDQAVPGPRGTLRRCGHWQLPGDFDIQRVHTYPCARSPRWLDTPGDAGNALLFWTGVQFHLPRESRCRNPNIRPHPMVHLLLLGEMTRGGLLASPLPHSLSTPPPRAPMPRARPRPVRPSISPSPHHTGNGGLGFRPLPKRVSRVGNQSIRHLVWHALAKVKLTVKIQRAVNWDDRYVSPFLSFLSLCIPHAQCDIACQPTSRTGMLG